MLKFMDTPLYQMVVVHEDFKGPRCLPRFKCPYGAVLYDLPYLFYSILDIATKLMAERDVLQRSVSRKGLK